MATIRKDRGSLEIEETTYHWRVDYTNMQIRFQNDTYSEVTHNVVLTIYPAANRSARIHVRFRDEAIRLVWYTERFSEQVVSITPMTVRQVLHFALQRRWNPHAQDDVLKIDKAERKFPGAINTFGVDRLRNFWEQINTS